MNSTNSAYFFVFSSKSLFPKSKNPDVELELELVFLHLY